MGKKEEEKNASFIRLRPCVPSCFTFEKSFVVFCFFDASTRRLTSAQHSTAVTRDRNFVSMVLIKYPHQYREEERRVEGGIKEVENQRLDEEIFFCFKICPLSCWRHVSASFVTHILYLSFDVFTEKISIFFSFFLFSLLKTKKKKLIVGCYGTHCPSSAGHAVCSP